jgi:hypothetical protein
VNHTAIDSRVRELFDTPPPVHGDGDHCWKVSLRCAQYIASAVDASSRTIETGCGLSTLIFALRETSHVCVVPDKQEVARLREYCAGVGISLESVTFYIEPSQQCLPRLETGNFDFILIDGCHSFPSPFIDWYYLEPKLLVDGILMIDDTHLWTPRVLRNILTADPHWRLLEEIPPRTAILRKLKQGSSNIAWSEQPYVRARSKVSILEQSIDHLLCLFRVFIRRFKKT